MIFWGFERINEFDYFFFVEGENCYFVFSLKWVFYSVILRYFVGRKGINIGVLFNIFWDRGVLYDYFVFFSMVLLVKEYIVLLG